MRSICEPSDSHKLILTHDKKSTNIRNMSLYANVMSPKTRQNSITTSDDKTRNDIMYKLNEDLYTHTQFGRKTATRCMSNLTCYKFKRECVLF